MTISNATPVYAVPEANLVPVSGHLKRHDGHPAIAHVPDQQVAQGVPGEESRRADLRRLAGRRRRIACPACRSRFWNAPHSCRSSMAPPTTCPSAPMPTAKSWSKSTGSWTASLGCGPANVLGTGGGRDALVKAYQAMLALGHGRQGDVIVSRACRGSPTTGDRTASGRTCCGRPATRQRAGRIPRTASAPAWNLPPQAGARSPGWSSPIPTTPPA